MIKIIKIKQSINADQRKSLYLLSDIYGLHTQENVDYLDNEKIHYEVICYEKICLLDLNGTLAEKCKFANNSYEVEKDVYSQELAKEISKHDWFVIIITARPLRYAKETIKRINEQVPYLGWKCYVPNQSSLRVHDFKREYAKKLIKSGIPQRHIVGIESNSNTRREYWNIGVKSFPRQEFLSREILF